MVLHHSKYSSKYVPFVLYAPCWSINVVFPPFSKCDTPLRGIFVSLNVVRVQQHLNLGTFHQLAYYGAQKLKNAFWFLITTRLSTICFSISSTLSSPNQGDLEFPSIQQPWNPHLAHVDAFPISQYLC